MMRIEAEERETYNEVYLCMEYMDYTLHRLIHSQQVPLTEQMMQFILYQLLSAIHYMHSAEIIHRDMKPENILINKKLELKIADMNLARKEIETEQATYYVTSRPYRAPEIFINSNAYTKAIDIWSIGCIFAEMLGKTVLFRGNDYIDQMRRFVAVLGKPTLDLFPGLDPIAAQGLARVFKEIPDRDKLQWNFLFPKVALSPPRPASGHSTSSTICSSTTPRRATQLRSASTIPFCRTTRTALVPSARRPSTFLSTR